MDETGFGNFLYQDAGFLSHAGCIHAGSHQLAVLSSGHKYGIVLRCVVAYCWFFDDLCYLLFPAILGAQTDWDLLGAETPWTLSQFARAVCGFWGFGGWACVSVFFFFDR